MRNASIARRSRPAGAIPCCCTTSAFCSRTWAAGARRWKPTKGRCTAIRASRTVITISRSFARPWASPGTPSGTWRSIEGWSSREDDCVQVLKTILAGALLLAISSAALGQTATAPNPLATRRGFEVGGQIAHYHYEEPSVMNLIGPRIGAVGSFTFAQVGLFFRAEVRGSYGRLKYQGTGTQDNVPDSIFETRFLVGKDFPVGDKIVLSPYGGLGYRALY